MATQPQLQQLIGSSSSSSSIPTIGGYMNNNKNGVSPFSPTHSNSVLTNAAIARLIRREWRNNRVVVRSGTGGGGGGGGGSVGGVPAAAGDGVRVSDVLWPSAGAFAAMAALGRLDQMMAPRGLSMTIAPFGAVCAVLFATPNSPAAQKYNMFMAQIGCSAFGVLALSLFGPGWLARGIALAASIAFMIVTGAVHPPAASLPLLFIDGAKLHRLHLWYVLFPGAAGCVLLCLIQEMVVYLKNNYKF